MSSTAGRNELLSFVMGVSLGILVISGAVAGFAAVSIVPSLLDALSATKQAAQNPNKAPAKSADKSSKRTPTAQTAHPPHAATRTPTASRPAKATTPKPKPKPKPTAPPEEASENVVSIQVGKKWVKAALLDETLHVVERIEKRTAIGDEFMSTDADGEFWIVRLMVWNDSKETRTISASTMEIIDSEGRTFHTSSEGGTALVMNGDKTAEFLLTQVQPGVMKRITVVFDVPRGLKNAKLKVSGGWGSGDALLKL